MDDFAIVVDKVRDDGMELLLWGVVGLGVRGDSLIDGWRIQLIIIWYRIFLFTSLIQHLHTTYPHLLLFPSLSYYPLFFLFIPLHHHLLHNFKHLLNLSLELEHQISKYLLIRFLQKLNTLV